MNEGQRPIYLDYHATTPVDPRVADVVLHYMTHAFGNASSVDHVFGDTAEQAVERARQHVAKLVGAEPESVIFTSGATESINLGIQGFCRSLRQQGTARPVRIGLMPVEHRAVLDTCEALAELGKAELHYFRVDGCARLDLGDVERKCRNLGLDLVCVMVANNEVGTLYPISEVAAIAHEHGACLLTDATQAAGKIELRFAEWNLDFLALSAHKMYGPKGVGALLIAPGMGVQPLLWGGGQERELRPGTSNVPAIAGFGEACRLQRLEMRDEHRRVERHRDRLQAFLADTIPELVVNGDVAHRLPGNLHVSISGVPNAAVVARIRETVALSTGSACSSGIEAPSHVLRAMRLRDDLVEGALRIGVGKFTTEAEIRAAGTLILEAVDEVRQLI